MNARTALDTAIIVVTIIITRMDKTELKSFTSALFLVEKSVEHLVWGLGLVYRLV